MRKIIGCICLILCSVVKGVAEDVVIRVADYKGNRKCAISYTFDDGLLEHYTQVFPQMEKLGIKGTFFVCGKNILKKTLPEEKTFMSWEQLREMSNKGHEIANHTWSHANLTNLSWEEIETEIWKNDSIVKTMTGKEPLTVCYPWNAFNDTLQQWILNRKIATRTYQYAVGGGNARSTVESLEQWAENLKTSGDWGVTMGHGIHYGFDCFPDPTVLWKHFEWVKKQEADIWVAPFAEVGAYLRERDNIQLEIVHNDTSCVIIPRLELNPEVYKEYLTLLVRSGERIISVSQEGRALEVRTVGDESWFDFNPFAGPVTIEFQVTPEKRYAELQKKLAEGWNTWDTRSVLTHVFLPYGFGVDLNLMDEKGKRVNEFKIGDRGHNAPLLHPGPHSYDGTYTQLMVEWQGFKFQVESAAQGNSNLILVSPAKENRKGGRLVVVPELLWKRGNVLTLDSLGFTLAPKDKSVEIRTVVKGELLEKRGREFVYSLDKPIAICCGTDLSLDEAADYVEEQGKAFIRSNRETFGGNYDCYNAMQSVLGWDNIYDPSIRKVITPVSRIWSSEWFASQDFGGFTLFCWDTYFASMMLAVGNKALAYANAVEITKAITERGFVPNCFYSNGFKSRDRSQPPVGSLAVWTLYEQYKDKWLLELLYDELLSWNRWWEKNRVDKGLLCLGSNPYEKVTYFRSEYDTDCHYGAVLESGLDNSPMYDGVPFNKEKHLLEQNDVGMSSLYVMDCDYLALIAEEIGRKEDVVELKRRGKLYRNNLKQLWDETTGFFYNRSTRDLKFNYRTSPTCFYPLLAKVPTQEQADRMIREHLLNPKEFWGEYVIPSVPKNDKAFKDNEYWRGRIWAPLNFLVYLGLRNYEFPGVKYQFAEKSKELLLKSWLKRGYVFENYNAETGEGDDVLRSDKFYHWGALLGYISLIENGVVNINNK